MVSCKSSHISAFVAGVRCVGIDFRYWSGGIKSFWCFDGFCSFCPEGEWIRVSGGLAAFRNAAVRSFPLAHQPLPDLIRAGQFPQRIGPKVATETLAETLISVRGPITKADHLHYFCNLGHSCFRPSCFPRKIICIRTGFPRLPSFRQESDLCWWHEYDNTCLLLIPADSTVENRFFAVVPVGLSDVKICPPFPFHVLCKLYPSAVCWPRRFAITVLSRWYNNRCAWRNVYFLYVVAFRASTLRLRSAWHHNVEHCVTQPCIQCTALTHFATVRGMVFGSYKETCFKCNS